MLFGTLWRVVLVESPVILKELNYPIIGLLLSTYQR